MDQGAEHQGRPADQGGFHGGQLQCLHPAPGMMRDGGAARVLLRRFGPLGFRVAAAQVQHDGAVPQLDVGGGGGMAAVRGDREADARCEQDDRVRRSHDVQLGTAGLHAEGRVGVVRAGRKDNPRRSGPREDPDQAGDAFRRRFQVVRDRDVGPAGFHDHGAVHVALAQDLRGLHGFHREVARRVTAEQMGKKGPRVRQRMAHPADPGVRGDERGGGAVADHGMPFQADGVFPEQPGPAEFKQNGQDPGEGLRVPEPVRRGRGPLADAQAQVRPAQGGHGGLIAGGVPGVEGGADPEHGPQVFHGGALGRFHHGQVQDGAVDDEGQPVRPGDFLGLLGDQRDDVGGRRAGVHGDGDGLPLDGDPAVGAHGFGEGLAGLLQHGFGGQGQPVGEAHVELGAVRADKVHLCREPGDGGQVAQGAPGDDGRVGVREGGQRPEGNCGAAQRQGFGGNAFRFAQGAAVIAGHEQPRRAGQDLEFRQQLWRQAVVGGVGLHKGAEQAQGQGFRQEGRVGKGLVERGGHGRSPSGCPQCLHETVPAGRASSISRLDFPWVSRRLRVM